MSSPMFNRVALIGIGLIGSSISHAMRRGGPSGPLARTIVGHAQSQATRDTAVKLGLISQAYATAAEAAKGADLVILCVPVGACGAIAARIGPQLAPGAIVTDVGSVKGAIVRDVAPHLPAGVHFVPGHPIAGTEYSGPDSGFASLFDQRWCILTPPPGTDPTATEKMKRLWEGMGSNVEVMSPEHHDMVLAITSHVPHLIAFNIVNTAAHLERVTDSEVIKFLGRRLSRFHAHRRVRSDDVARRVLEQQGGRARDAGSLLGRLDGAAARDPVRRRRHAVSPVQRITRRAQEHHPGRPGYRRS